MIDEEDDFKKMDVGVLTCGVELVFDSSMESVLPHLRAQEIADLVDAFFRFSHVPGVAILLYGKTDGTDLGSHICSFDAHRIRVSPKKILPQVSAKSRCGGNKAAPNLRTGIAMVLCHELTHANQYHEHASADRHQDGKFYGVMASGRPIPFKHYMGRPCEVEARRTVDENMDVIHALLGKEVRRETVAGPKDDPMAEILGIVDGFSELKEVSVSDIRDELRLSNLNNPLNVQAAAEMLRKRGVRVR